MLHSGYDFLRRVQSRLRIVHNRSLDELPEATEEVDKLARRLGFEAERDSWRSWRNTRRRSANYFSDW